MKNTLFQSDLDGAAIRMLAEEITEAGYKWRFEAKTGNVENDARIHLYTGEEGQSTVGTPHPDARTFYSNSMLDAFELAADWVRGEQGKPSLAEEAVASVAQQGQEVYFQSGAKCVCGSDAPLVIKRTVYLRCHWETGNTYYSGDLNPEGGTAHFKGLNVPLLPGEFGTCADCGKSYRFAL